MLKTTLSLQLAAFLALAGVLSPVAAEGPLDQAAPIHGIMPDAPAPFTGVIEGEAVECGDIERKITLITPRVVVGEPVLLRLAIRNKEPRISREFMANMTFGNDIRIRVTPEPRTRIRPYEYLGIPRGATGATATLDMQGVPFYRFDFRMAFDGETVSGAAFDTPGTYRLEVSHNCLLGGGNVERLFMGTFDVVVERAEGDDARALELLNDLRAFRALQLHAARDIDRSTLVTEPLMQRFKRLVEEFPNARVRPHAAFVLADYHLLQRDFEKCIEVLELIMRDYPETPHEEQAAFQLLPLYRFHRPDTAARDLYHFLWSHPVYTQLLHPENDNFTRYITPWTRTVANVGSQWMIFPQPGPDPEVGETVEGPTVILPEGLQRAFGLPEVITPEIYRQLLEQQGMGEPR